MKQKFISGIYNYCDRWCERCPFTTRCRNFESRGTLSSEQLDINNKAFWDSISDNFKKAIELLHKAAKEYGIDLNKPMTEEEEEEYERRESFIETTTKSHLLTKLCDQYRKVAMPFFKEEISKELVEKTNGLVKNVHMGITSKEDVLRTMAGLGECEEIIRWYLFFIDAKLQRALHEKIEGEGWEEDSGFQKDSDGSAKIAIIAIERSMNAWVKLYEVMPASEDVALKALSILSQLKKKALEEFPKAMEFKRPGFDD
ncbi:MAG TPA: hypothetical protein VFP97_14405 [Chitinophagaceae bacterium]|nr:hypothetical protein [Chitinophagaceae bacterium]